MMINTQYMGPAQWGWRVFHIGIMVFLGVVLASLLEDGKPISALAADTAVYIAGAGDISSCSNTNDSKTAQLLGSIAPAYVLALGDNVYDSGTLSEYQNCYEPTWGAWKSRTKPVPGNHEYQTSGAAGYFNYFGVPKYYAYNAGDWRIYALNSEIDTSTSSAQASWLKNDLAANPRKCVLAYWHRARWTSSSSGGGDSKTQALWSILYDAKAELVLVSHSHTYERFAPMNKSGQAVSAGVQEIVVGTGGKSHGSFVTTHPASRARNANTFGVLRLYLQSDRYSWKFLPISGQTYTDSGTIYCH